jgi:hypothetical protein
MDMDQLHKDIREAISEDQYTSDIIKSLTSDINSSYHTLHMLISDMSVRLLSKGCVLFLIVLFELNPRFLCCRLPYLLLHHNLTDPTDPTDLY